MTDTEPRPPIFKIILVGDVSTGKTSLLTQLMHRVPERLPKPTQSLSVFSMRISKPSATVVQIWDSPGDSKYHYQTLGSIANFDAVLLFVDVSNEYTFEKARLTASQIALYSPNLQMHLVQSKIELTERDPLKRKVSRDSVRRLAQKHRGGVFEYRQSESVESIVQDLLEWRTRGPEIARLQKEKELQQGVPMVKEVKFTAEQSNAECQCRIC